MLCYNYTLINFSKLTLAVTFGFIVHSLFQIKICVMSAGATGSIDNEEAMKKAESELLDFDSDDDVPANTPSSDIKDSDTAKLKIGVNRLSQDDDALAKNDVHAPQSTVAGGNDLSVKDKVAIPVEAVSEKQTDEQMDTIDEDCLQIRADADPDLIAFENDEENNVVESEKAKNKEHKDSFLPFEINISKFRIPASADTKKENFQQRHEAGAGSHQVRKHVPAPDGYTFLEHIFSTRSGTGPSSLGPSLAGGLNAIKPVLELYPTSASDLTRGSDGGQQKPLQLDCRFTVSACFDSGAMICFCKTGKSKSQKHLFASHTPYLVIIGDSYVPPNLGWNGNCAICIRIEDPKPDNVVRAVEDFFANCILPLHSVVILSLTSLLAEVGAAGYYNAIEVLINRLGSFFCSRYQNKLVRPANWMEIFKVNFVHVITPFEKTDRDTAIQILSGATVLANLAYASRQQYSGHVTDALHEFFERYCKSSNKEETGATTLPVWSSNINRWSGKINIDVYLGLTRLTPGILSVFWCDVLDRINIMCQETGINRSAIPSRDDVYRCVRDTTMVNFDLGRYMPEIVRLANGDDTKPGQFNPIKSDKKVYVLGASTTHTVHQKLHSKGIENHYIKMQGGHLSEEFISQVECSTVPKGSIFILDAFCNNLVGTLIPASGLGEECVKSPLEMKGAGKPAKFPSAYTDGKGDGPTVFHMSEGSKLCRFLRTLDDMQIEKLVELVSKAISKWVEKHDAKVIILGPFPRFPTFCCNARAHQTENPEILSKLIRDLNYFISSAAVFNTNFEGGNTVALPFHVMVQNLDVEPFGGHGVVHYDNVHPVAEVTDAVVGILTRVLAGDWRQIGFGPGGRGPNISFAAWREALREASQDCLHKTECVGLLKADPNPLTATQKRNLSAIYDPEDGYYATANADNVAPDGPTAQSTDYSDDQQHESRVDYNHGHDQVHSGGQLFQGSNRGRQIIQTHIVGAKKLQHTEHRGSRGARGGQVRGRGGSWWKEGQGGRGFGRGRGGRRGGGHRGGSGHGGGGQGRGGRGGGGRGRGHRGL